MPKEEGKHMSYRDNRITGYLVRITIKEIGEKYSSLVTGMHRRSNQKKWVTVICDEEGKPLSTFHGDFKGEDREWIKEKIEEAGYYNVGLRN